MVVRNDFLAVLNAEEWIECMRAYRNVLFSFFCEDLFFKKGLFELLDSVYYESSSKCENIKSLNRVKSGDYFWIDIVVLSSKSIFEKLPKRDRAFGDDGAGVVVFCSENMTHVIKGMSGYENTIFFTDDLKLSDVKRVFRKIIFGDSNNRKEIFEKISFDRLTDREKLVSELLEKGKSQQQISKLTGMTVKTVSSHLRSAMCKHHVNSVVEYRVKLSYLKDVKSN